MRLLSWLLVAACGFFIVVSLLPDPNPASSRSAAPAPSARPVDCSRMAQYPSCAIGLAAAAGGAFGAAAACGVPMDRITIVINEVGDSMRSVSRGPQDNQDALALFRSTMEASRNNTPARDCPAVTLAFQEMERNIRRR